MQKIISVYSYGKSKSNCKNVFDALSNTKQQDISKWQKARKMEIQSPSQQGARVESGMVIVATKNMCQNWNNGQSGSATNINSERSH